MAVIVRIVTMVVAYALACVAASLVLALGMLAADWNEYTFWFADQPTAVQYAAFWAVVAIGATVIFAVAMLPMLLIVALTEGLALRSIVVYGIIGAALALVMAFGLDFAGYGANAAGELPREQEIFAAAGISGGLVYWLFAGRRAGCWRRRLRESETTRS